MAEEDPVEDIEKMAEKKSKNLELKLDLFQRENKKRKRLLQKKKRQRNLLNHHKLYLKNLK